MNPFSNPFYLLPPLVTLVISIILLVIVRLKSPHNFGNTIFCGLLFSVSLWSIFIFGMRSSQDMHDALIWDRAITPIVYLTYLLYYHFTLVHTNTPGQRRILLSAYIMLGVIIILSPTALLIEGMVIYEYGYAPVPGILASPFAVSGLLLLGGGVMTLLRRYRVSKSYEERNRLVYLATAALFPLIGALLDGFSDLPPAAVWGYLIFCLLCTIAILRYHLLDIRIALRKSLVYLVMSVILAIPYVGILFLLYSLIKPAMEKWWVHIIVILLLAVILHPIYSWAQDLADRLFYRERYSSFRALEQFTQQAQSITDLEELGSSMINLIKGALRVTSIYLFLPSDEKQEYSVVSSSGIERPAPDMTFGFNSPLVTWLDSYGKIITSEQLDVVPKLQSLSLKDKNNIRLSGAELYIPLKTRREQLSGILVLGSKLSQQPYTGEEIRLLLTLGSHLAITLENAHLYTSEKKLRIELEKQNEQKTEFLNQVAHEMKTPLTSLISSSELLEDQLNTKNDIIKRLIGNLRRSAGIMDRRVSELLELARAQNRQLQLKMQPLEIGSVISEIASDLDSIFESRKQQLAKEVAVTLPKVNADRGRLEQIIYNLLSNASKFSPEGSEVMLRVRNGDDSVIVEVEDEAPRITDLEKNRIFNPYYRGEDTAEQYAVPGLGLGLYITRKLVELHNGKIWVTGSPAKGNIFSFSLPAQK